MRCGPRIRRTPSFPGSARTAVAERKELFVSRTLLRLLPVAALAAALTVSTLPVGPQAVAAAATPAASVEADLISRINAARTAAGVAPLRVDATLVSGARAWSTRMASAGSLSHDSSFSAGTAWAENVGYTTRSDAAATLHSSFMSSTGHRANILNPRYTAVGVGAVTAGGTTWATQRFAVLEDITPVATTTTEVAAAPAPSPEPDLVLTPTPFPEPESTVAEPTATEPAVTAATTEQAAPAPRQEPRASRTTARPAQAAAKPAPARPQQSRQVRPQQECAGARPPAREHARATECAPKRGNGHGPVNAQAQANRAEGNGRGPNR
jgi:uncharacterized protein YkwD